jgi:hypothetical protein
MKWAAFIFVVLFLWLGGTNSSAVNEWNTSEHDYHMGACKRYKQGSTAGDTPQCGNYKSKTGYGCCCDICDGYYSECVKINRLPQERCEKIKAACQKDCNLFLSN